MLPLSAMAQIAAAGAAAGAAAAAGEGQGSQNPWIGGFGVVDTHGVNVAAYTLSLGGESGVSLSAVGDAIAYFLATLLWDLYRVWVAVALWIVDWALQFRILDLLAGPSAAIGQALQSTLVRLGVTGLLLAIAYLALLRAVNDGQAARGVVTIVISLLMSALLHSPSLSLSLAPALSGPSGGLSTARDIGVALALQATSAGMDPDAQAQEPLSRAEFDPSAATSPTMARVTRDKLRQQTTARLVDVFVRIPHQLINYGAVVDTNEKCAGVYQEILTTDAGTEEARTKMGECDTAYKQAAEKPAQAAQGALFTGLNGGLLLVSALAFALLLLGACVVALWEGGLTAWHVLKAILPGETRGELWTSFGIICFALIAIIGALFGLGLMTGLVSAVFVGDEAPLSKFVIVGLVQLLAAVSLILTVVQLRRKGELLGQRIAKSLEPHAPQGQRPRVLAPVAALAGQAATTAWATRHLGAGRTARSAAAGAAAGVGATAGASTGSLGGRALRAAGKSVKTGAVVTAKTGVIAAKGTLGAPVYLPRAAGAIKKTIEAKKDQARQGLTKAAAAKDTKVSQARDFAAEYRRGLHTFATPVRAMMGSPEGRQPYGPVSDDGPMTKREPHAAAHPASSLSTPAAASTPVRAGQAAAARARRQPAPTPGPSTTAAQASPAAFGTHAPAGAGAVGPHPAGPARAGAAANARPAPAAPTAPGVNRPAAPNPITTPEHRPAPTAVTPTAVTPTRPPEPTKPTAGASAPSPITTPETWTSRVRAKAPRPRPMTVGRR